MYKILFFGDSNTYGYDPGSFIGGRYPAAVRWTDRLAAFGQGRWEILPYGMNGRCIPEPEYDRKYLDSLLTEAGRIDLFACMLGTNDIFLTGHPDAVLAEKHMDAFLTYLQGKQNIKEILLIAPPADDPDRTGDTALKRYLKEARRLPGLYREIAERKGIRFADADSWSIPLAYDSVHFTEEGHRIFAIQMKKVLDEIIRVC